MRKAALFLLLAAPALGQNSYQGGTLRNHGHTTAAGDGGALTNPSITSLNVSTANITGRLSVGGIVYSSGTHNQVGAYVGSGSETHTGKISLYDTLSVSTGIIISSASPNGVLSPNALYSDKIVQAWVVFSATGTLAIQYSVGVTSVTVRGVGAYRINWARPFANPFYAVMINFEARTASNSDNCSIRDDVDPTIFNVDIDCVNGAETSVDEDKLHVIAIGAQ